MSDVTTRSRAHKGRAPRQAGENRWLQGSSVGLIAWINSYWDTSSQDYYLSLIGDKENHLKLTGSWEVMYGEQDTFIHILEYEGFKGLDDTLALVRKTNVSVLNL